MCLFNGDWGGWLIWIMIEFISSLGFSRGLVSKTGASLAPGVLCGFLFMSDLSPLTARDFPGLDSNRSNAKLSEHGFNQW